MSQPPRPQAHGPAQRRRRQMKFEAVQPLEERCLLAPVVAVSPILAAGAGHDQAGTSAPTNVTVTLGTADTGFLTAAPFTSVSELTPISSFGGDIVRIRSGPGGPFGNDVYAISRGAGENSANLTAAPERQQQHHPLDRLRRDQPAGRDLPGRPGHGQDQRLLRPEHVDPAARTPQQQGGHRRQLRRRRRPGWSTGTTSPSTPKGTSTASRRCSSPASTARTPRRTPSTGSPRTARSWASSSTSTRVRRQQPRGQPQRHRRAPRPRTRASSAA